MTKVNLVKRKYSDRYDWERVLEKRYIEKYVEDEFFKGYLSLIFIDKVKSPLIIKVNDEELKLVDEGYKWMQHIPLHKNYAVTTMFNKNNEVIQWYFDIIKRSGIEDGRVFFDDLYLDIVHLPSGHTLLLDEDELKESLHNEIITEQDYILAHTTAQKLIDEITRGDNEIINRYRKYLYHMLSEHSL